MENENIYRMIQFLTHNGKLSREQQKKRDELLARDCSGMLLEQSGDESGVTGNKKIAISSGRLHMPRKVSAFLGLFSGDNSLKFTTHNWDNDEFSNYEDFYQGYKNVVKDNELWNILYFCNIHLYYLIYNYLFFTGGNEGGKENFWSRYQITVGLRNPQGVIGKWLEENPDKQMFDMPLSVYEKGYMLKPGRIDGKIPQYFGDLVELFKHSIEFRDSRFYFKMKELFKSSDFTVDEAALKTLKGISFYTATEQVLSAMMEIKDNIRNRKDKSSEARIWMEQDKDTFVLHILHVGSYSDADIENEKLMLRANSQMSKIKNLLQSLCDFSVVSRFIEDGSETDARIDYLYTDDASSSPRITRLEPGESAGFEYILKFYK